MKIKEMKKSECYYLTIEETRAPRPYETEYRRDSHGNWEQLWASSWETEGKGEHGLEVLFQEYIKTHPENKGNTIIIIVAGGLIQVMSTDMENPPSIEVYDFDIFECASDNEIEDAFGKVCTRSELRNELEKRTATMVNLY